MTDTRTLPKQAQARLKWPLRLTLAGMFAERVTVALWPFVTVVLALLAALMFDVHVALPIELAWGTLVLSAGLGLAAIIYAFRRFRLPTRAEALARLDKTLPGRPIAALMDSQAIGAGDAASEAVWQTHVERMADRARQAKAPSPDLRIARFDPYALRYVAVLAFVMALIFGSILRVASVGEVINGPGTGLAGGPAWEGWIEPPPYTGKPSLYLADLTDDTLSVPAGSHLTLRLYGQVGALTVAETVSGRTGVVAGAADATQDFDIMQSGTLEISGPGGRKWAITVSPDALPTIRPDGEAERGVDGEMRLPFAAADDYGVVSGRAEITLDLAKVERRFGLALDPEPQPTIVLDLPLPLTGSRTDLQGVLVENLAQHPWATLPVKVRLFARDAAGQSGMAEPESTILPGRRFFDPLANALIEQRRSLLWNRQNGREVAQVLRAVSYRPDDVFDSSTAYLMLRVAIRRLETAVEFDQFDTARRDEIAQALWDIATLIEDGNLSDALERLRRAQDRLSEAMKQGASDQEIAELMQELRQAMQNYMQQLAENAQPNDQQAQNQNQQEITPDQLQEMLNKLQELMEQGRTEEAQQLLDQLRQMMENMQVTQGQGQQSPGQQALQGLADTLRQQQGLNDDTFNGLQDQFSQQGQQGQQGQGQEGQQGQGPQGQNGQQGQGRSGQGGQQGQEQGPGQGSQQGMGLADRQQGLRDLLNQQAQNMPGLGTPGGEAGRDALGRAGRAMDGAEEALRQNDLGGAINKQADAMEALREGMRELSQQLAQQQQQGQGQQGEAFGQNNNSNGRDPLGRDSGNAGRIGTDEQLLQGEDVYSRARKLLDEIRRRSSDQSRPTLELDYLKRLLNRF